MNDQHKDFDAAAEMAVMTELVISQVRKLSELHEEGILTDEEFTAKKQELLARL